MLHALTRKANTPNPALVRDPFFNFVDRFFSDLAWPAGNALEFDAAKFTPAVDIVETENAFVAKADLPGLTKDDIELSLEDGVLSISGERTFKHEEKGEGKSFRRIERAYGSFRRAFTLPQGVDVDKVEASFTDGVLTLTLPKTEIVKARKIAIS
jgi:HSP20 family protein